MLNGLDPIIIFQFKKLTAEAQESVMKIPVVSSIVNAIGLPPIPIYLSEELTGLYIDTEEKNIDIETTTETLPDGGQPKTKQKALNSVVRIQLKAVIGSIGLTLITAMADAVLPKVTSQEYSITYLHGSTTIFEGLLHSFSITQSGDNNLMLITIELAKTTQLTPTKQPITEIAPVGTSIDGTAAAAAAPTTPLTPPLPSPPASAIPSPGTPPPVSLKGLG